MSAYTLPEVCTEHDAAAFLQVNPSVIGRMCRAGKLPAVKVGRSWRILRKHILTYLESSSCQEKTQVRASNGAPNATSLKSSGSNTAPAAAKARALLAAQQLSNISSSISQRSPKTTAQVIQIHG